MFLMGISLLLISSSTANYLLFTLFGMGIMVSIGAANVVSMTFTQTVTPTEMLGKVMAFGSAFATVCIPIGQVLFGTMLDYMKDHIFLLVILASIFTTVVTLLVRWNVKQVK